MYNLTGVLYITTIVSGCWCNFTILKNDGVKVSWDDDIPIYSGKTTCLKPPSRNEHEWT